MPKKEKVAIKRASDFAEVDDELTEALALLEESNSRVEAVLTGEHVTDEEATEAEGGEVPDWADAPAPEAEAEEAGEETSGDGQEDAPAIEDDEA